MSLASRVTALANRVGQEIALLTQVGTLLASEIGELHNTVDSIAQPAESFRSQGLIANPSFELWNNDTNPQGWNAVWTAGSPVRSKGPGRVGLHSLRVTFPAGSGQNQRLMSTVIPVQPGQLFYLEAWARRQSGSPSIRAEVAAGTGTDLGPWSADQTATLLNEASQVTAPIGEWQKFSWFVTVPTSGGITHILPQVHLEANAAAEVLLDDVYFAPVAIPPGTLEPEIGGSIDNQDYYEKYPDGRLVCMGTYNFPSNMNTGQSFVWQFPILFVGVKPHVTAIGESTVPQNFFLGLLDHNYHATKIRFYRTTAAGTTVHFRADGRWK